MPKEALNIHMYNGSQYTRGPSSSMSSIVGLVLDVGPNVAPSLIDFCFGLQHL